MSARAMAAAALVGAALVGVMSAACFSERSDDLTGPIGNGDCRFDVGSPIVGSTQAIVAINNFAFRTAEVRVRAGTTVTWINCEPAGTEAHTSTSDTGVWNSPLLRTGESFSRTFNQTGRFPYHCAPHPFMTGVVVVE